MSAARTVIGHALTPERVLRLDCDTKAEAFDVLIGCLSEAPEIGDANVLRREMFAREELMSTGLGNGFGVPHVRLESVSALVMAAGVNRRALADYEALDGKPVRVICMVAARADQHADYLRVLAALSHVMKNGAARKALLATKEPGAIYEIFVNPG
mgnify:CR=1 FL=1